MVTQWQAGNAKRRNLPEIARCIARTCGSHNPLDLRDDASSEHYVKTLDILLHSQDFDALMVIHSPSAAAPATESAQVLVKR